jgi:acetolactate synthase-1/2/3 large subunit
VIAFTGGRDATTKFRGVYQEVDDLPSFDTVTKFNATIDDVGRIPDLVRQAFRVAVSGAPGPVHLQFAGNEGQIDQGEAEMEVLCEPLFARVPPFRPVASDAELAAAITLIEGAARPVIVAGGGVRASGASAALVRLAELLNLPVATSLNGKDTIADTHPRSVGVVGTYSRASANRVVGEADLVVFVGTSTGGMTTHFWQVPHLGRRAIQIDIDPESLGRNYPLEVAIQADALTALTRMAELAEANRSETRQAWADHALGIVSAWREEWRPLTDSEAVPLRPERISAELSWLLPDDSIVVVDTGHAGMWMGGFYDVRVAGQSYMRSAGHLGWAFPASLGAKCASPDRPVVCFTGDSGFWYHIAEIETAVRFGINTITVVNDNHSGNQSMRGFDRAYGGKQTEQARELWVFTDVDFARLAEEIGAIGIRVEKPEEFGRAMERALEADRPVIIDVVTDIEAVAPPAVV